MGFSGQDGRRPHALCHLWFQLAATSQTSRMGLSYALVVGCAYVRRLAHKATAVDSFLGQTAPLLAALASRCTEFTTPTIDHILFDALTTRGAFKAGLTVETITA